MQSWPLDIFKNDRPPPGYIPGVGRGAIGFVTRNDVGPASAAPELGAAAGAARAGGRREGEEGEGAEGEEGGGARGRGGGGGGGGDAFGSGRLFATAAYDAEDAEADRIYEGVEKRMEERAKRKRSEKEEEEARAARRGESRIADQFGDLKQKLASVTSAEWEAIPDIGDPSLRGKKRALDKATPVPDSLLLASVGLSAGGGGGGGGGGSGAAAASAAADAAPDIRGLSAARGHMLSLRLGRVSDSVGAGGGRTSLDASGYLTALTAEESGSLTSRGADIADIKKARLMFKSMVATNPGLGTAWISAARLEEEVKDLPAARRLIAQGCAACPGDEDVWAEAARLATPASARAVLAEAVARLPHAVNLWLLAAGLEGGAEARKEVLRKALTLTPSSERLWKEAVALEGAEDARIMLARAVECVPLSLDLWLALARLETYANAQRVLNQARLALPSEPGVWIAAARLEETAGGADAALLVKIMGRALKSLQGRQVLIDREAWFKYAEEAERGGSAGTSAAIVCAVLDVGVEEADRLRTWKADAAALEARGCAAGARAVHTRLLEDYPAQPALWRAAAQFEKRLGGARSAAAVDALLRRAVSYCPQAEVLWLFAAKEAWLGGDVPRARLILTEAFAANPGSEAVWVAAVKLEWENGELGMARGLLERARAAAPSPRVWLKSALLEREAGAVAAERALLAEGCSRFPAAPKLWMMRGQLEGRCGDFARAREAYAAGVRHCPGSLPLWTLGGGLEEAAGGGSAAGYARARTLLESARCRNPGQPVLWLAAVRLERRAGSAHAAEALLAKALKECPASGLLLAEDIESAPRAAQRRKSVDALSKADSDAQVVLAVARLFASERKVDKARKWFARACTLDPDFGDALAAWYAFEEENGDAGEVERLEGVAARCEPAHGERWQAVAKAVGAGRLSKVEVLKRTARVVREEDARRRALALEEAAR